jgi:hypothetical protein
VSKLLSSLKRVYEMEVIGLYDDVLLFDVCYDLKELYEALIPRAASHKAALQRRAEYQFDLPVLESTDKIAHELFLVEQLEPHLLKTVSNLNEALRASPRHKMIAVDLAIDAMHIDYPLIAHISVSNDPILRWILERRNQKADTVISYSGLRWLFSRQANEV